MVMIIMMIGPSFDALFGIWVFSTCFPIVRILLVLRRSRVGRVALVGVELGGWVGEVVVVVAWGVVDTMAGDLVEEGWMGMGDRSSVVGTMACREQGLPVMRLAVLIIIIITTNSQKKNWSLKVVWSLIRRILAFFYSLFWNWNWDWD